MWSRFRVPIIYSKSGWFSVKCAKLRVPIIYSKFIGKKKYIPCEDCGVLTTSNYDKSKQHACKSSAKKNLPAKRQGISICPKKSKLFKGKKFRIDNESMEETNTKEQSMVVTKPQEVMAKPQLETKP